MPILAINGGKKIRNKLFPPYSVISEEEKKAAIRVIESQSLSKYIGAWGNDFLGGVEVQALEEEWANYYGVKYAIAVNSATSGLYCAMGATGIGPGDEAIVSPYTMSASATSIIAFNAVPIFADIEDDFYCLDVNSIEKKITSRTKVIVVVDIFGQPYNALEINALAKKYNLTVIEDAAQAPFSKYGNQLTGTLADLGVFSLNYHKHIHTGEGGIIVTNNEELALKCRMIRNHAEACMDGYIKENPTFNITNMLGFNFRMPEIEAAIAREQLKKLELLVNRRQENVNYLENKLSQISFLTMPKIRESCSHAYYVHAMRYNSSLAKGISREIFAKAVAAELMPIKLRENEGVKISCGYVKPLYLLPIFQEKIAYGKLGCPFSCQYYDNETNYSKGTCPVCEDMHFKKIITHELMRPGMLKSDLDDVINAFMKVADNLDELTEAF